MAIIDKDAVERIRAAKQWYQDNADDAPKDAAYAIGGALFGFSLDLRTDREESNNLAGWYNAGARWAEFHASYAQLLAVDALATVGTVMKLPVCDVDPLGWLMNALNSSFDGQILDEDEEGNEIGGEDYDPSDMQEEKRREWFRVPSWRHQGPVEAKHVGAWLTGAVVYWRMVRDLV